MHVGLVLFAFRNGSEWSSEAAARAICPNSLRRRCCISEEIEPHSIVVSVDCIGFDHTLFIILYAAIQLFFAATMSINVQYSVFSNDSSDYLQSSSSSDRADSRGPLRQPSGHDDEPWTTWHECRRVYRRRSAGSVNGTGVLAVAANQDKNGGQFLLLRPVIMRGGLACGHQVSPHG